MTLKKQLIYYACTCPINHVIKQVKQDKIQGNFCNDIFQLTRFEKEIEIIHKPPNFIIIIPLFQRKQRRQTTYNTKNTEKNVKKKWLQKNYETLQATGSRKLPTTNLSLQWLERALHAKPFYLYSKALNFITFISLLSLPISFKLRLKLLFH